MFRWIRMLSTVALTATLTISLSGMTLHAAPLRDDPKPEKSASKDKEKDADKEKDKESKDKDAALPRVAHIKLSGSPGEGPTESGPFSSPSENLSAKITRIQKAADDKAVQALYLDLKGLDVGFGKLNELRTAIAAFRKTGKKVFAYAEEFGTKEYLLAIGSDVVALPVSGGLDVTGLRAEVSYYKPALDMLKLKADVLKMGDYKSAVEPFIAESMGDANREQLESLLDDNYENEVVGVIRAARPDRKWSADDVKAVIDQGPFTAQKAAKLGLIDTLCYEDEFAALIAKKLGVDEVKIERDYGKAKKDELDFSNPFKLLEAFSPPRKPKESKEPKVAVVYVVGGIESGSGSVNPLMGGESVGSDTIVKAVREADKNPLVKAIVLRVDSPGGSALASDMMWRALVKCEKPVVISMGDVAASGGYYIAGGGQRIFAEPGTVTGSIGVFGLKLVTGGLEKWAGVNTAVVKRGQNSGVNSTTFEWTESQRKAMTETIETVYDQFLDRVLEGRKRAGVEMTREELKKIAGGRVWTGRQALANKLVDELGTLDDAVKYAAKLGGLPADKPIERLLLPKPQSFFDKLAEGDLGLPFGALRVIPGAEKALKQVGPLLRLNDQPLKMVMPLQVDWK